MIALKLLMMIQILMSSFISLSYKDLDHNGIINELAISSYFIHQNKLQNYH